MYIYILTVLFATLIKIYDDLVDYYKMRHGCSLAELLKVIITCIFTLLLFNSNNLYIQLIILNVLSSSIFYTKSYFQDRYFKAFTLVFWIISFIIVNMNYNNINIKYSIILLSIAFLQFIMYVLQEKSNLMDDLGLNKFQIKDEEVGKNKLYFRLISVIIAIIFLLYGNNKVKNHFKIDDFKWLVAANCQSLIILSYSFVSIIQQFKILYC